jgi:hypothetical protein
LVHQLGVYVTVYFVRRKGRVKGPLSREKLVALQQEDRLRMQDEIGPSEDGPWQRLIDIYDEVFGDESTTAYADNPAEDEFWTEDPPAEKPAVRGGSKGKPAAAAKPGRSTSGSSAGLFGGKIKPWQLIAAVSGVGGLAGLGAVAWMLWAPLAEAPTDPNEIAAAINAENPGPVRKAKPKPRLTATKQPADGTAAAPDAPAEPPATRPPAPAGTQTATVDTAATQPPSADTTTQSAPAAGDDAASTTEQPQDPVEAIKSLLTAYYSAGNWQARYRLVKESDEAKLLMRKLYEDVDWISVQWSIAKMPGANDLLAAARSGEPVRVDTLTNGNPHSVYVVFTDGSWQIDWLHSLNTLWLSK